MRPVGKSMIGIVVDFDKQAIRASGYGGASHRRYFVAATGAVRGICDDRQVRELLNDGNRGDIESVAV